MWAKSTVRNFFRNLPQQNFWRAPICLVIRNHFTFLKVLMFFCFSILRTVVPANYSFFAAPRTVVTRLQMVKEWIILFSMLRLILRGGPFFFRITFLAFDSQRVQATVDSEHTGRRSWTTWVHFFQILAGTRWNFGAHSTACFTRTNEFILKHLTCTFCLPNNTLLIYVGQDKLDHSC